MSATSARPADEHELEGESARASDLVVAWLVVVGATVGSVVGLLWMDAQDPPPLVQSMVVLWSLVVAMALLLMAAATFSWFTDRE